MIGNYRWALVVCMLGFVTTAYCIEVGTSVASVSHEGRSEVVGAFSFTFNTDELPGASPDTPIYIRFGLNRFQGWAETLVDLRDGSAYDVPINLALYPEGGSQINPTLPASAVQLVRMVEGESYAWIKITQPSSIWMWVNGAATGPSNDNKVSLSLGIRGSISVRDGSSTPSGGNEYADTHALADTRLKANYFETPGFNNGDTDNLSLVAFDQETRGVENGTPIQGNLLGIGFSNDLTIARAVNYYPCYEYHFAKDNYDAPAHDVALSHLDLIQRRTYRTEIPGVYLSNSSDFDWDPGSTFFLTYPGFDPTYIMDGTPSPNSNYPGIPTTHLLPNPLSLTTEGSDQWEVAEVWSSGTFMGYQFTLVAGKLAIYDALKVDGIRIGTLFARDAEEGEPLELTAWAWFYAQGINSSNTPQALFPITARTANFGLGGVAHQTVLPYAGYDREDLVFSAHINNPHDEPVRVTALVYHPVGLLEEVVGDVMMPPNSQMSLVLDESWPDDKRKQGWMSIYSEKPIAAAAELIHKNGSTYDISAPSGPLSEVLYGAHVTADPAWETHAYMVSADPTVDPAFSVRSGDTDAISWIDGFLIPSGTGDLTNSDFDNPNAPTGRDQWFEVDAGEATGAGLVLYNALEGAGMMASVPMLSEARPSWRYDHVGNYANGWWSGLVLANPGDTPAFTVIEALDEHDQTLGTATLQIPPQQRTVSLLHSLMPRFAPARIQVVSERPVLSFLLMGRVEGNRVTTIPGNLKSGTHLAMPYFPALDQYWVGLALINDGFQVAPVLITPYRPDGTPGPSELVLIEPDSKHLLALGDLIDNEAGYSHLKLHCTEAFKAYALTGSMDTARLATLPIEIMTP